MKYIYSTILFLLFLFLITSLINFNYTQEVESIDISKNDISDISIDVNDANVALSTTVGNDIKIEHIYSEEQNPSSKIYTYQDGGTLYINEYPYNQENLISKKETINIYLPEQIVYEQVDVKSESGQINIDSCFTKNLNISSKTGNVDLMKVNSNQINLNGGQIGVQLSNVVAKNVKTSIDKTKLNISNSIIDDLRISNQGSSIVNIDKLVATNVSIDGEQTAVSLNLNNANDYQLITSSLVSNPLLTTNDDGYEYLVNKSKTVVIYKINTLDTINVNFVKIEDDSDE